MAKLEAKEEGTYRLIWDPAMEDSTYLLSTLSILSALSLYLTLWAKHYYYHTHLISEQNELERNEISQLISNGNGILPWSFWFQILILWSSCITNCHFAYLVYQDNFLRKGCLFSIYLSLSDRCGVVLQSYRRHSPKHLFTWYKQRRNQFRPLNCFYRFQRTWSIFCLNLLSVIEEEGAIQQAGHYSWETQEPGSRHLL